MQEKERDELKELCKKHGIFYNFALAYKESQPQLSNKEVVEYFVKNKDKHTKKGKGTKK